MTNPSRGYGRVRWTICVVNTNIGSKDCQKCSSDNGNSDDFLECWWLSDAKIGVNKHICDWGKKKIHSEETATTKTKLKVKVDHYYLWKVFFFSSLHSWFIDPVPKISVCMIWFFDIMVCHRRCFVYLRLTESLAHWHTQNVNIIT